MPKSNFNGLMGRSRRENFNSPKMLPKSFSHTKSQSLNEECNQNDLSAIDAESEQQAAMMLQHLMLSRNSNNLPKTSSPTVSSMVASSSQSNSYRTTLSNSKGQVETTDIYEDPSEHYSVIGKPQMVTSFQTSTPVRNTTTYSSFQDKMGKRKMTHL